MRVQLSSAVAAAAAAAAMLVSRTSADMITIKVGASGLIYDSNNVVAKVGDDVMFTFDSSLTHNVVQGDPSKPCSPVAGGFFSGNLKGPGKTFMITITTLDPIYYYCSEGSHCKSGMVGVINAPSGALDTYKSGASSASKGEDPSSTGTQIAAATATTSSTVAMDTPATAATTSMDDGTVTVISMPVDTTSTTSAAAEETTGMSMSGMDMGGGTSATAATAAPSTVSMNGGVERMAGGIVAILLVEGATLTWLSL